MPHLAIDQDHPVRTTRSQYVYSFTVKHHGRGGANASYWLEVISLEEEFEIFNRADEFQLSDIDGNLYGIQRIGGTLRILGNWEQQIAEYPAQRPNTAWHGYPCFPLGTQAPDHLQGNRCRPHRSVFALMEERAMLTTQERKRLWKGDHV